MVKGGSAGSTFAERTESKRAMRDVRPADQAVDGQRPSARYSPMRKEGAIGLGTGGDNSNAAQGNWFEGVMTAHYSSDQADNDVQASIASVYGQPQ